MYIPERFQEAIDSHMLGNMLDIPRYPLLLAIVGKPGMGKTYQLREYLKRTGVSIISVSADDFESELAGEPAKLIKRKYVEASSIITKEQTAVLIIDDIDTTLGEWENNTGTVNHQDILALFMHLADSPTFIEDIGVVKRVPIFFTGNYAEKMYIPLMRDGRANYLEWEPTKDEKVRIIQETFHFENEKTASLLIEAFPDKTVSFFTSLIANKVMHQFVTSCGSVVFNKIIYDCNYKNNLIRRYNDCFSLIDWNEFAQKEIERKNMDTDKREEEK